jgi:hypothetical protein
MSRSGYSDDCDDQWSLIRWRGAVASSIRGKNGQAFLRELLAARDAMPEKRLIPHSFGEAGSYCTLGVVGASRGAEMPVLPGDPYDVDPDDVRKQVTQALGIPDALAAEIMFLNDEGAWYDETPEKRWSRMREWVASQIRQPAELAEAHA